LLRARFWLERASDLGDEYAKAELERLRLKLDEMGLE
jgi:hypothetical protein